MDVCLLWLLCVVRSLRRADHSPRGVIPTVVYRCVWSRNLKGEEAMARAGPQRHEKKIPLFIIYFVVFLTTGPWPRPKRVFHRVRSSASSFSLQYLLVFSRLSSSCSRLLPLPVYKSWNVELTVAAEVVHFPNLTPGYKGVGGKGVQLNPILNLALCKIECSASLPGRFIPGNPLNRRLGGPMNQ